MSSEYERYCSFSDHAVISQINGLSQIYEVQYIPSYKKNLYYAYEAYKDSKENWNNLVEFYRNEVYGDDTEQRDNDSRLMFQNALDKFGETYVLTEVEKYLYNNDDTRDFRVFLKELRGENND